jgi:hypothetical protein
MAPEAERVAEAEERNNFTAVGAVCAMLLASEARPLENEMKHTEASSGEGAEPEVAATSLSLTALADNAVTVDTVNNSKDKEQPSELLEQEGERESDASSEDDEEEEEGDDDDDDEEDEDEDEDDDDDEVKAGDDASISSSTPREKQEDQQDPSEHNKEADNDLPVLKQELRNVLSESAIWRESVLKRSVPPGSPFTLPSKASVLVAECAQRAVPQPSERERNTEMRSGAIATESGAQQRWRNIGGRGSASDTGAAPVASEGLAVPGQQAEVHAAVSHVHPRKDALHPERQIVDSLRMHADEITRRRLRAATQVPPPQFEEVPAPPKQPNPEARGFRGAAPAPPPLAPEPGAAPVPRGGPVAARSLLRRSEKGYPAGYVVWQVKREGDSEGLSCDATHPLALGGRREALREAHRELCQNPHVRSQPLKSKLGSATGLYGRLAPERPLPRVQSLPALPVRQESRALLLQGLHGSPQRCWDLR